MSIHLRQDRTTFVEPSNIRVGLSRYEINVPAALHKYVPRVPGVANNPETSLNAKILAEEFRLWCDQKYVGAKLHKDQVAHLSVKDAVPALVVYWVDLREILPNADFKRLNNLAVSSLCQLQYAWFGAKNRQALSVFAKAMKLCAFEGIERMLRAGADIQTAEDLPDIFVHALHGAEATVATRESRENNNNHASFARLDSEMLDVAQVCAIDGEVWRFWWRCKDEIFERCRALIGDESASSTETDTDYGCEVFARAAQRNEWRKPLSTFAALGRETPVTFYEPLFQVREKNDPMLPSAKRVTHHLLKKLLASGPHFLVIGVDRWAWQCIEREAGESRVPDLLDDFIVSGKGFDAEKRKALSASLMHEDESGLRLIIRIAACLKKYNPNLRISFAGEKDEDIVFSKSNHVEVIERLACGGKGRVCIVSGWELFSDSREEWRMKGVRHNLISHIELRPAGDHLPLALSQSLSVATNVYGYSPSGCGTVAFYPEDIESLPRRDRRGQFAHIDGDNGGNTHSALWRILEASTLILATEGHADGGDIYAAGSERDPRDRSFR